MTVFTTGLLCTALVTFSPVLVKTVFLGGAGRFSTLLVAFGVGGLLGAAGLLGTAASVDLRALSSIFALAYGAILVCVALEPWFWDLPILLMLAGAATAVSNMAANTLVQSTARPELLGRTVSLYMLAVRGGASLGALVTGAVVTVLGVRRALLFDGLAAIALQAILAYWWRADRPGAAHQVPALTSAAGLVVSLPAWASRLFDRASEFLRGEPFVSHRPARFGQPTFPGRHRGAPHERDQPGTRCFAIVGLGAMYPADDDQHAVSRDGSPGQRPQAVFHVRWAR